MSREHQQMRVRLPPELRDSLEQMAKKNGRSMNAEIVYRLQRTFEEDAELVESSVKVLEGMHIDRAALMMPPGTILTPHEIDRKDSRYNSDSLSEQLREMRELLESISQEIKTKND